MRWFRRLQGASTPSAIPPRAANRGLCRFRPAPGEARRRAFPRIWRPQEGVSRGPLDQCRTFAQPGLAPLMRLESDGRRLDSYSRSCLARVLARTKASAPSARTSKPLVHGPGSCRCALMRGMCSSRKTRKRIVPKRAAANRAFFPKMIAAPAATKTTPIAQAQSGRTGNQGGPSPTARRA